MDCPAGPVASGRQRPLHRGAQIRQGEGLGQDIGDDGIEPPRALALIGEAGHQQDGQVGEIALGRQGQRDAVHERHADIGEHQIEAAVGLVEAIEPVTAIAGRDDRMAVDLQPPLEEAPDGLFVIHQEDARHVVP